MPLNKTTSPFFPAGKSSSFQIAGAEDLNVSDLRWGSSWVGTPPKLHGGEVTVASGFQDPGKLVVGTFSWSCCFGVFLLFTIGKLQLNQNLREWVFYFLQAFLCKSKSMSDIGQLVIASF